MAPHSSTLAWKIPWTEEPGRLQSMGSLRVGHDWPTSLSHFTFMHWRRTWQPTPVFLPGESQGQGSLVGCRLWGHRVGHDWSDLAAAAAPCEIKEEIKVVDGDKGQKVTFGEWSVVNGELEVLFVDVFWSHGIGTLKFDWAVNEFVYFTRVLYLEKCGLACGEYTICLVLGIQEHTIQSVHQRWLSCGKDNELAVTDAGITLATFSQPQELLLS